ncbi:sialate O-acetylesterase [Telluribacter sp. SYSU D00476]|uniref:T9SS type A sorting domain-containing protein n=1 Tax=Telluribacter sp. SYSU D00476 TaxID=2811430 RepID=UPI001FF5D0E8|nr:sialate O-acetylesterase [Telluribacter sp. SYSU D00476]
MRKSSTCHLFIKIWLLIVCIPVVASAQIKITSPTDRAIYQRDITGQTTLSITGTYSQPIDKVEVRAVPVVPGQGIGTDWATLQNNPTGGTFLGTLRLQGGWYTLEVRGLQNQTVVGRDVVPRMGVGEVFLIAGQSNAQGLRNYPGPSAKDDRVNYIAYDNIVNSLFDPPAPTFAQLTSNAMVGPHGQSAWNWGLLGDMLARKLNVPILFINTAWEGTSIRNWTQSAKGETTYNVYGGFVYPPQMPYANLAIAARHYVNTLGARAVLWMQGETDTHPLNMSKSEYQEHLQFLINRLSGDINKRITWVIARTSRTATADNRQQFTSQAIIDAQNAVINTPFNSTYPGPETDKINVTRPDGIHFIGDEALTALANAWDNTLNTTFFSTITPLTPAAIPVVTTACASDNNAVSLTLPAGYSSYSWSTGQSGRTINVSSPGTYRATLKDANGNAYLSQAVTVENSVKPITPTVIPGGQQQACADSGLVLSASGGTDQFLWSNGTTGRATRALQSGNYTVRAQNVFGCLSDVSAPVGLTIRPAVPQPTVVQSGPFSMQATLPSQDLSVTYDWKRNDQVLSSGSSVIKAVETGDYTARAKAVYNLGNNNQLTCYSPFSSPIAYIPSEGETVVIFPNPARGGVLSIETREDLTDAQVTFFGVNGVMLRTQTIPTLSERRTIDASTLPPGMYIIKVKAAGTDVSKKIIID